MFRSLIFSCLIQAALVSMAIGAGPYGTIRVGAWMGGAYTDDNTGAFSHCAATSAYASGVSLVVGLNTANAWLLGFASPAFHYKTGDRLPIDVTFDGQSQARLFATANSPVMTTAILPANVARTFQKASLMVASTDGSAFQFNLTSTAPLLAALASCATKVKAEGIKTAGDFVECEDRRRETGRAGSDAASRGAQARESRQQDRHRFRDQRQRPHRDQSTRRRGCGEIRGNLTGEPSTTLRLVSSDESNDLALLQGPATSFKEFARIRDRRFAPAIPWSRSAFPITGC